MAEARCPASLGFARPKIDSTLIPSAYRSLEHDSNLWHQYYRKEYCRVSHPHLALICRAEGGIHGPKAVEMLVDFIAPRKVAPGYSNHRHGIAVDFSTVEGGETLTAETGRSNKDLKKHNKRWEKSWFYRWLETHKAEYDTERIPSEAWHWEFGNTAPAKSPKASPPPRARAPEVSQA